MYSSPLLGAVGTFGAGTFGTGGRPLPLKSDIDDFIPCLDLKALFAALLLQNNHQIKETDFYSRCIEPSPDLTFSSVSGCRRKVFKRVFRITYRSNTDSERKYDAVKIRYFEVHLYMLAYRSDTWST